MFSAFYVGTTIKIIKLQNVYLLFFHSTWKITFQSHFVRVRIIRTTYQRDQYVIQEHFYLRCIVLSTISFSFSPQKKAINSHRRTHRTCRDICHLTWISQLHLHWITILMYLIVPLLIENQGQLIISLQISTNKNPSCIYIMYVCIVYIHCGCPCACDAEFTVDIQLQFYQRLHYVFINGTHLEYRPPPWNTRNP